MNLTGYELPAWRTATMLLAAGALLACGGSGGGAGSSGSSVSSSISSSSSSSASNVAVLFDDFSYADTLAMAANGWTVRTGGGGPGVSGAVWMADHVSFHTDQGETYLRLRASTSGPDVPVTQSQVTYEGEHLHGTFAARMQFTNAPTSGPNGDLVVQAFYGITPLNFPLDPSYSEVDFEYLPNGGWGQTQASLFLTTWETYRPEPWVADNLSAVLNGDYAGWHLLLVQVDQNEVRYYIDGELSATHGGAFVPETAMSINFNIWFIENGLIASTDERFYQQQVDWVFFADQQILASAEVEAQVAALRHAGVAFRDSVNHAADPADCGTTWYSARLTHYESYPDPDSEECVVYNGCTWAGQFYGLDGVQPESWVAANNIIAVHAKDWEWLGMRSVNLRQGDHWINGTVYDLCADSDCDGCCTANLGGDGYLIDIEKYTMQRFGSDDGIVEFQVCDNVIEP